MMLKQVDECEKEIHEFTTLNNNYSRERHLVTKKAFLTEDGIYEVLMQSRKPIAKQWKKEVKKILKQIRLTGGTVQEDREAEFIENYFPSFSEDVKKAMVLDLREQNKQLQDKLNEATPKLEEHQRFQDKKGSFNPTEIVDKLREEGIKPEFIRGAKSLNQFLHDCDIQYYKGGVWKLYADFKYLLEDGSAIEIKAEANRFMKNQLRWTPKGYDFIVGKLKEAEDKYKKLKEIKRQLKLVK